MFIFTSNNMLMQTDRVMLMYINENYIGSEGKDGISIEVCIGPDRKDQNNIIVLEEFESDEKFVAEDAFCQLSYRIDKAPNNTVINLADIVKRAKYEYRTGMQYKE